jgi:hypothetical protein
MSKCGHVLLVTHAAAVAVILAGAAADAAECLAQPNRAPSDGEHWYYRTNRATDQKCWYLRARDAETTGSTAGPPSTRADAASEPPSKDSQLSVGEQRELFMEFLDWRARRETR